MIGTVMIVVMVVMEMMMLLVKLIIMLMMLLIIHAHIQAFTLHYIYIYIDIHSRDLHRIMRSKIISYSGDVQLHLVLWLEADIKDFKDLKGPLPHSMIMAHAHFCVTRGSHASRSSMKSAALSQPGYKSSRTRGGIGQRGAAGPGNIIISLSLSLSLYLAL